MINTNIAQAELSNTDLTNALLQETGLGPAVCVLNQVVNCLVEPAGSPVRPPF
ncbi:hypothetical protein ACL6C3_06305 [Capilliphycus salinus ALCB114379]|uniref:hypothetical protein n=1 Tax=Capilliphycus salinus TaxID=2768948 RepID=UPI0039A4FB1B